MTTKDIESRLHRSLHKQVALRKLDARFNLAVWERIAREEVPAATPARPRGASWLLASNVLGIAVALALIVYFLVRNVSGIDIEMNVPLPEISADSTAAVLKMLGWGVSAGSVAFGLAFTRSGRRLLHFLRSEFA